MFAVDAAASLLQFARQIRFRSECSPAVGTEAAAEKGTSARPAGSFLTKLHRFRAHPEGGFYAFISRCEGLQVAQAV
jgi:hypothetical protein